MTGALAPERSVETEAPDLELTLPARPENVAVARHAIGGVADVVEGPHQTLADVKLAVTEACTNVVVHAYPNGEGPMGLRATVDDTVLRVVIVDHGRGILPRADSPGLGLGLPLIATLAESLELGTGNNDETEVRMTFRLDAVPADDLRPQCPPSPPPRPRRRSRSARARSSDRSSAASSECSPRGHTAQSTASPPLCCSPTRSPRTRRR